MIIPAAVQQCSLLILAVIALLFLVNHLRRLLSGYFSPLLRLRGPPSENLVYGNFRQIGPDAAQLHLEWIKEYGTSFLGRFFFQLPTLLTIDPRTINHVLTHTTYYEKPLESLKDLARILGEDGIIVIEGERHKRQRRVMNPAFGPTQIRELTEVFLAKANDLCTYWNTQIATQGESIPINVIEGLSRMTLDVIGLAGFNYQFETLNPDLPPNELSVAFNDIFKDPPKLSISNLVFNLLPSLHLVRDKRTKTIDDALVTMQKIAREILNERKTEILREKAGGLGKRDVQGRDLLTILLKANMATDMPENQRMTDEEVLAQIPTFLVAGHETTSTATTWCLYAITRAPAIQRKLRDEVRAVPTATPSMDALNALPYLEQVVRETLRLHAPVTTVIRIATHDDVLPVSTPYTDRYGKVCSEIAIGKGDRVVIPVTALHTHKAIWGEDAFEFRPERWDNPPEAISSIPGVFGHILTFLGGPHACIGYRFALVEMKALMFTLLRNFEFELAVPDEDIKASGLFLQRPAVAREENEKGSQLPLLIRPCRRV
ncbi:cytochrome P450 [Daedaleopsis nitida]|nr:cytochrome P450 [Daedaleopsis nitida]